MAVDVKNLVHGEQYWIVHTGRGKQQMDMGRLYSADYPKGHEPTFQTIDGTLRLDEVVMVVGKVEVPQMPMYQEGYYAAKFRKDDANWLFVRYDPISNAFVDAIDGLKWPSRSFAFIGKYLGTADDLAGDA